VKKKIAHFCGLLLLELFLFLRPKERRWGMGCYTLYTVGTPRRLKRENERNGPMKKYSIWKWAEWNGAPIGPSLLKGWGLVSVSRSPVERRPSRARTQLLSRNTRSWALLTVLVLV